jgi:hypothetical protein
VQAFVRLGQVVHALADVVVDWDCIIECMAQMITIITGQRGVGDDVTPLETDKIFNTIQRFKDYTIFVSDDALIKLTTSLVSLSMHVITAANASQPAASSGAPADKAGQGKLSGPLLSVTVAAKDVVQRIASVPDAVRQLQPLMGAADSGMSRPMPSSSGTATYYWISAPPYLAELLAAGVVSYALYAAIDIVKINSYRVSRVWQMVISHLRMIALSKVNTLLRDESGLCF